MNFREQDNVIRRSPAKERLQFCLPFVWALVCALVLFWLVARNVGYAGLLGPVTYASDLVSQNGLISKVFPEGRLTAPQKIDGGYEQIVLAEPLYIDVAMPKRFKRAVVRVWYQAPASPQVGWRIHAQGELPYALVAPQITTERGWSVARAEFSLANSFVIKGKAQAVISFAASFKRGEQPKIHKVTVEFLP